MCAQSVGRGIALLFHDRGTRRGWVFSNTPRPHFTPGKEPVPILQKAGWATGPVWMGGRSRPHGYSIPDRPARNQSLYRLSYPALISCIVRDSKPNEQFFKIPFYVIILICTWHESSCEVYRRYSGNFTGFPATSFHCLLLLYFHTFLLLQQTLVLRD